MLGKIKGGLVKFFIFSCASLTILIVAFSSYGLTSAEATYMLTGIIAAVGLLANHFNFPSEYPHRNAIYYPAIFVGGICCVVFYTMHSDQEEERLIALRVSDPNAYLTELKVNDEDKWFIEIEELSPSAYDAEVARRDEVARFEEEERLASEAAAETERLEKAAKAQVADQQQIDALLIALDGVSEENLDAHLAVYEDIVLLAPQNDEYKLKLAEFRQRKWEENLPYEHPEMFVKIRNVRKYYNDYKLVDTLQFDLTNELSWEVQDIVVACDYYARSGTFLAREANILYDVIPSKGTLKVQDFDIGFEPDQMVRRECIVAGVS